MYISIRLWDDRKNEMKDFLNLNVPRTCSLGKEREGERERGERVRERRTGEDRRGEEKERD